MITRWVRHYENNGDIEYYSFNIDEQADFNEYLNNYYGGYWDWEVVDKPPKEWLDKEINNLLELIKSHALQIQSLMELYNEPPHKL